VATGLPVIAVKSLVVAIERSGISMKRLLSLAAAGLMCSAGLLASSGVAGATTSTPSHQQIVQPGGPLLRVGGHQNNFPTVSTNWSGYASTSKTPFNSVQATFVEPAVTCPGVANQWTSNWVGLDGYGDQTVEQDGTYGYCGGKGNTTPEYEAWIELYPEPSVNAFKIAPGDIIHESVVYANGKFTLTVSDLTSGKTHTTVGTSKNAERSSAEWIIERPALCADKSCSKAILAELADYHSTSMSGASASVDGGKLQPPSAFNTYPIYMFCPITHGLISLDTVSALSGPSFTATWDRHGTTTPISLAPLR
jgi:hypothetical protein